MSFLLQQCSRAQHISKTNTLRLMPAVQLKVNRNKSNTPPANTIAHANAPSTSWLPIYRLPLIRWAAAFNKLKVYQTILTAFATPMVYTLEEAGTFAPNSWQVCAAIGITGIITLTISSYGVQNLVGFIYINQSEDKLKLAYVDFWGKREELEVDVDDLVPDIEQEKPSRFDFYQAIRLHSNDKLKFKLLQRYGVAVDPEKFAYYFGE